MNDAYPCSLVLAAHGSVAHENSNQPVLDVATSIERQRIFSKVTPAFLHGRPSLETVLDSLPIGDVIVVPMMTSRGYFSQTVIPQQLMENPSFRQHRVLVTSELGTHPRMATLVSTRIQQCLQAFQFDSENTSVLLIGHGTRRNPNSGTATYELADQIRNEVTEVDLHVAFLDQDPELNEVVAQTRHQHRLAIPFLISRGPHTTIDVPEAMGLPSGPGIEFPLIRCIDNRLVVCDLPVGMYVEIPDICIELAADKMLSVTPDIQNFSSARREPGK